MADTTDNGNRDRPNNDRLNSWKEIATHLGCSVRTVQRWEQEFGLPVHRRKRARGETVLAFKSELDAWERRVASQIAAQRAQPQNGEAAAGSEQQDPRAAEGGEEHSPASESESSRTAANSEVRPRASELEDSRVGPGRGDDGDSSRGGVLIDVSAEDDRPAPPVFGRRRARGIRWIAVACAVLALAGLAWAWSRPRLGPVDTAAWDPLGKTLTARDAAGHNLWSNHIAVAVDPEPYTAEGQRTSGPSVLVDDVDADGRKEILFIARAVSPADSFLYGFNDDGALRFRHRADNTVRCGADTYAGDLFSVTRVFLGDGADRPIWVVSSHREFPTLVQRLAPDGSVRSSTWLNGHVRALVETEHGGRRVLLTGGTSNDPAPLGTAALTAIDPDQATGAVPATQGRYRCGAPSDPPPAAFIKLPLLDTAQVSGARAYVRELYVTPDRRIDAIVEQGSRSVTGTSDLLVSTVKYTLDFDLNVLEAVLEDNFLTLHAVEERAGRLDHRCGTAEQEGLWNILAWRNGKPAAVHPPAASRHP